MGGIFMFILLIANYDYVENNTVKSGVHQTVLGLNDITPSLMDFILTNEIKQKYNRDVMNFTHIFKQQGINA